MTTATRPASTTDLILALRLPPSVLRRAVRDGVLHPTKVGRQHVFVGGIDEARVALQAAGILPAGEVLLPQAAELALPTL